MKSFPQLLVFLCIVIFSSCSSESEGEPDTQSEINVKPTAVVLSLDGQDCNSVSVSWSVSMDENENDVVKYKVYINNIIIESELSVTQLTIDAASLSYPFAIKIIAFDDDLSESDSSNILQIETPVSDNIVFTSTNLKQALLDNETLIDLNNDGEISECEAFLFTGTLNLSLKNISSLDDLIHFTQATVLDVRGNSISDVSVLTALSFEKVYFGFNVFVDFNMGSNSKLKTLWLGNNQITSIDLSLYENLEDVNLTDNLLTNIDITGNPLLINLYLDRNSISQIDTSFNTQLKLFGISENELTQIDLTNNTDLEWLAVSNNLLSFLFIEENSNLRDLYCSDNFIEELDLSNLIDLDRIYCYRNQLTKLNLQNSNNSSISQMIATENPSLNCIQVDDESNIPDGWAKDAAADYLVNCN